MVTMSLLLGAGLHFLGECSRTFAVSSLHRVFLSGFQQRLGLLYPGRVFGLSNPRHENLVELLHPIRPRACLPRVGRPLRVQGVVAHTIRVGAGGPLQLEAVFLGELLRLLGVVVVEQREGKLNRVSWETITAGQAIAAATGWPLEAAVVGSGAASIASEVAGKKLAKVYDVELAVTEGKKTVETDADITFNEKSFTIMPDKANFKSSAKTINYTDVKQADHSYSKKPMLSGGGAIALAVMPWRPPSIASVFVSPSTPAFVVE